MEGLKVHDSFGVAGFEGAHVGADEVAGAVAVEGGFVLAADDGEGAEDVVGILPLDAVEARIVTKLNSWQQACVLLQSCGQGRRRGIILRHRPPLDLELNFQ